MPPPTVTRGTGWRERYLSIPPAKSPMSSIAWSGRSCIACTTRSDVAPVQPATWRSPLATATSMPRWIDAIHAAQEKGRTIPVVPRIDSPPSIPSRGFQVRRAIAAPPGTLTVTSTSGARPCAEAASATASSIIARGTGLIAGSPTPIGSPGRVTVPTPSPARKTTPPREAATRTRISAPCVTSGSSPASLTTPASAQPGPVAAWLTAKRGASPRGSRIVTASGTPPPHSPSSAARQAAVAQAPVVQPRRRGRGSVIARRLAWRPPPANGRAGAFPARDVAPYRAHGSAAPP